MIQKQMTGHLPLEPAGRGFDNEHQHRIQYNSGLFQLALDLEVGWFDGVGVDGIGKAKNVKKRQDVATTK